MIKKISMVLFSLIIVILIVGCGTEKKEEMLVCTSVEKEEGMEIEQVISMTYKNDKLKRMTMAVNTKITDATVQENWEAFKTEMDKENKEFDQDGVSLKIEKNDQNYEYKTTLDIDVENASEKILEEQGFSGLKDDTSTLKSSKEEAEKDGATCQVK